MTRLVQALSAIVIFLHGANAQGVAWAQCGGIGWTGAKTCVSGNVCTYSNDYYSQCIPVTGGATTTTTKVAATTTKAATTKATTTTTKSAAAGTPKVYVCGDSTAATWPATNALQGWAAFLQYSLKAIVVNKAISGRSARSFTVEGHFQEVANLAVKGDFVIIEFGHNDGGSLNPDNGRSDCPGAGSETCTTAAGLVVQTYPTYIINAAKLMIAKGAKVIFSSPTPNNPWESGTFSYASGRFSTYSKAAAVTVGSQASYVDHGQYTANIFKTLGAATTDSYFPNDHTHTNAAGATVVQRAFVKGLLCSNNFLAPWVKNSTTSVQGACI